MQPRIVGMLPKLPSHDIARRIVVDPRQLAISHQSVDFCVELGSRDKAILVLEHLRSHGREHVERRLVPAIEELDQLPGNDEVRFVGDAYLAGLVENRPSPLRAAVATEWCASGRSGASSKALSTARFAAARPSGDRS